MATNIVNFEETKAALLYYAHTHKGYTVMSSGRRLFMIHKDSETNEPLETLDIIFKTASYTEANLTVKDILNGKSNNLYPIDICYMEKFNALAKGEISRYNEDGTLNEYLKDGSVIKDAGLQEIYIELANETDKGHFQ